MLCNLRRDRPGVRVYFATDKKIFYIATATFLNNQSTGNSRHVGFESLVCVVTNRRIWTWV